jgi:hypothetical protein
MICCIYKYCLIVCCLSVFCFLSYDLLLSVHCLMICCIYKYVFWCCLRVCGCAAYVCGGLLLLFGSCWCFPAVWACGVLLGLALSLCLLWLYFLLSFDVYLSYDVRFSPLLGDVVSLFPVWYFLCQV